MNEYMNTYFFFKTKLQFDCLTKMKQNKSTQVCGELFDLYSRDKKKYMIKIIESSIQEKTGECTKANVC